MNHLDIDIYCASDPYPGQPIALVPAIGLRVFEYRHNMTFSTSSAPSGNLLVGFWVESCFRVARSEIPRELSVAAAKFTALSRS